MTGCASCGTDDDLLFTCGHCEDQFCAAHQFPHHACARFTEAGRAKATAEAEAVGFEFGDGSTVVTQTKPDVTEDETSGSTPAADATEPRETADVHAVPGPRVEVARDAARETRPDRYGAQERPPGRGMPWERGSDSVVDWMEAQTYPSYVLKVTLLSFVFTAAYYGGLAATLYGYV
jgi:hypothetical protein